MSNLNVFFNQDFELFDFTTNVFPRMAKIQWKAISEMQKVLNVLKSLCKLCKVIGHFQTSRMELFWENKLPLAALLVVTRVS